MLEGNQVRRWEILGCISPVRNPVSCMQSGQNDRSPQTHGILSAGTRITKQNYHPNLFPAPKLHWSAPLVHSPSQVTRWVWFYHTCAVYWQVTQPMTLTQGDSIICGDIFVKNTLCVELCNLYADMAKGRQHLMSGIYTYNVMFTGAKFYIFGPIHRNIKCQYPQKIVTLRS